MSKDKKQETPVLKMNSPTGAELRGINLKTKIITDAEHRGIKPLKGIKYAEILLPIVQEAILFHQTYRQHLADAIVWNNLRPTKEGGRATLELMLKNAENSQEKEQLRKDLEYWELNYEDIRINVYDHPLKFK